MSYSWHQNISVALCVCLLSNCGSSSADSPNITYPNYPMIFEKVFAPGERFDKPFNLLAANETTSGETQKSTSVESYGVEFSNFENNFPKAATLTLPDGQSVELVESSDVIGFFTGTLGDEFVSLTIGGGSQNFLNLGIARIAPDEYISAFGIVGYETPQIGLPASEIARYSGVSDTVIGGNVSSEPFGRGDMEISVDFSNGSVVGDLYRSADASISLVNGQVANNGFVGQLSATSPSVDSMVGTAQGIFYGDSAQDVGGVFEGSFSGPVGTGTVAGVFWGGLAPTD